MDNPFKILLIEDEENLKKIIQYNLELEKFKVRSVSQAPDILDLLRAEYFDLILLDIMLPELDGISICEKIRTHYQDIKIIFISAKSTSLDRVIGLKKGADDYLVKPFEFEELLFRIHKTLGSHNDSSFTNNSAVFGNNKIDFLNKQAINFKNETIHLTPKENALLKLLIDNENEILTREKILHIVWEYDVFPNTRTIDNFILQYRKYFENDPSKPIYFISKRGLGYMFQSNRKKEI